MVIISSFTVSEEGIRYQQPAIEVVFNDKNIGKGTLYIHERVLAWKSDNVPEYGFNIPYPDISLHALCRDQSSFPLPNIYIMLDGHVELPGEFVSTDVVNNVSNGVESDEDNDSIADITEIRLIPADDNTLSVIFEEIKQCQELNPDPNDSPLDEDDDEMDGGFGDDYEEEDFEPDSDRFESMNLNGSAQNGTDSRMFEDAD